MRSPFVVSYDFTKENGYIPSIALEWSKQVISGTTYYRIDVIEAHMKY